MPRVELTILGEPMGKQRPRFSTFNGYVKTHTPKETINYESKVVNAYREQYKEMVFDHNDQLSVTINAYFQIPKSRYRYHKKTNTTDLDKLGQDMECGNVRPTKKPDTDNIAKICLDALNGIAYPDDSQVVSLSVEKHYSEQPKVIIQIVRRDYESRTQRVLLF